MKKIISAVLLFAMALTLFACGAKPSFVKLETNDIKDVDLAVLPQKEIDKDEFIDAYNKATVKGKADDDDKKASDVILFFFENNEDILTVFYLGEDKFSVTGTAVEEDYIIDAPELADVYNNIINPPAKFVEIDESKIEAVDFVNDREATGDAAAFAKAYNESEFVKKAEGEKSNDVIILTYESSEGVLALQYLGEDQFLVSGSEVEVSFIVKSSDLADLYEDAIK